MTPPWKEGEPAWISLMDGDGSSPPYDTKVETFGGWGDGRIQIDYFSKSIGYWVCQPGDPTHWRPLP